MADEYLADEKRLMETGISLIDKREPEEDTDGKLVCFSTSKLPIRDDSGEVIGTFGISRDVTSHMEAENALRDSEALYHSLVENLFVHLIRKDLEGKFTYANKLFCELSSRAEDEIVGTADFDLYAKEMAEKYRANGLQVMKSGKTFEAMEENEAEQGRIYARVIKSPLYNASGKSVGVQNVFWDITEQKRSELKVLEQPNNPAANASKPC
tara:strand:- start:117 stop:749 length:633 start_codon:yes stop_codon:yes gene_type:complete